MPPSTLDTAHELEVIAGYLRYLAGGLDLADWEFQVEWGPELQSFATIEVVPNRQAAVIRVGEPYLDATEAERRYGFVHELLHARLDPVRQTAGTIDRLIGQVAYEVFSRNHDDALERVTDGLAKGWSRGVMTMEQWKRKGRK